MCAVARCYVWFDSRGRLGAQVRFESEGRHGVKRGSIPGAAHLRLELGRIAQLAEAADSNPVQ